MLDIGNLTTGSSAGRGGSKREKVLSSPTFPPPTCSTLSPLLPAFPAPYGVALTAASPPTPGERRLRPPPLQDDRTEGAVSRACLGVARGGAGCGEAGSFQPPQLDLGGQLSWLGVGGRSASCPLLSHPPRAQTALKQAADDAWGVGENSPYSLNGSLAVLGGVASAVYLQHLVWRLAGEGGSM